MNNPISSPTGIERLNAIHQNETKVMSHGLLTMVITRANTLSITKAVSRDTTRVRPAQCSDAKTNSIRLSSAPRLINTKGRITRLVTKFRPHLARNNSPKPTFAHVMTALNMKATVGSISRSGGIFFITLIKVLGVTLALGVFMNGKLVDNINIIVNWLILSTILAP